MTGLPDAAKEYSGPGALVVMLVYIILQVTGTMPQGATSGTQHLAEQLDDRIDALQGRLGDHDGRIQRAWTALNEAQAMRRALEGKITENQRILDRLTDRLDDQRNAMSAVTSTLAQVNAAVQDIKSTIDVMKFQVNALAEQQRRDGRAPGPAGGR